jgi:VWFA-related protein
VARFATAALLTIFAASSFDFAQDAPSISRGALLAQQPTFRTGANYVRVDMYASKDGVAVEDLKREEIEILEDGVPQKIDAFEHVKVRTLNPEESRVEPNTISESRRLASDPRARVFVIFLDTYHTQIEGSAKMRQPLMDFLNRVLGPDDMVAVMTPEMAATEITFARKTTVFSKMFDQNLFWGRRDRLVDDDEREELYKACYGPDSPIGREMKARRREKLTLDSLEDLMIHLGGIREERKAILAVTEGWRLYTKSAQLAGGDQNTRVTPGDVLGRPPVPRLSDTGQIQGSPKIQCEADRMALAQMDDDLRLHELTQLANRGNVTFYPVYARGLTVFDSPIGPDPPPSLAQDAANLRARQNSLRFLADDTDGTAIINTNNIEGMLRRIVDDLTSYYLMGYYTTNTKLDGRFRSISVRLKRPGVTVRARKGYRGYTEAEVARGTAASTPPPAASAPVTAALTPVVSFNARAQFRIRAATWAHASSSGTEGAFWVVGELDPQLRKQPAWSAAAQADVAIIGPDGQQVASRKIDVMPRDGAFSIQIPESGGVAAGDYTLRVRLRSPIEGELALSDTSRVSVKAETTLGEAVMWRRGPTTGPQYLRTADPRFQRSDRLRLELATSASEPVTARILDRNGTAMSVQAQVSERPDPSMQFKWVVIDVALAPFAASDYAIEAVQGQARQVTAFRVVP